MARRVRPVALACAALLLALAAPAQERALWSVDPATASLRRLVPGGLPERVLSLPGGPWQVRADLAGRAVVLAGARPGLWLVRGARATFVATEGPVVDAVPDGAGGAWAAVDLGAAGRLLRVDARGARLRALGRPRPARRLRWCADGALLLVERLAPGLARLLRLEAGTGAPVASLLLPGLPADLVRDDAGRTWLPGVPAGGLTALDDGLAVLGFDPALSARDVAPVRGGRLAILGGAPAALSFLGGGAAVPVPGASCLLALPDGGVLAVDVLAGRAFRVDPDLGVRWVGPWTGGSGDDGGGLEHARWRDERADPDGDGWPSREELVRGDDPGSPASAPLRLEVLPSGTGVRVVAPRHPGLGYALAAGRERMPVGAMEVLIPGSLLPETPFAAPVGTLDGLGRATVALLPGAVRPSGLVFMAAALWDPAAGLWVLRGPARPVRVP